MVELINHATFNLASSTLGIASDRVQHQWTWYVIRAAGFTAAGLLFLLMLSGIGQVTGLTYKFLEPIKAWMVHKAMAFALAAAIFIHVFLLLFDSFKPFTLTQILVPFASHYTNGSQLVVQGLTSLAVGLGILAMYGTALVILTSLGWINSHKLLWKRTHYVSYFVVFAVFIHALGTGSDLKYGIFRAAWIAVGSLLIVGILARLWRANLTIAKREA